MNFLKSLLRSLTSPFFIGLCLTFTSAALAFLFYARSGSDQRSAFFQVLHQIHERTIDARLRDRGYRAGHADIAIIAVDEKAVEHIGRWPWSRDKIAHIVHEAQKYGARVLAFDMTFPEPDPNSATPALLRLKNTVQSQKSNPVLLSAIDQELARANSDQTLAQQVASFKDHLVMGGYFDEEQTRAPHQHLCWDLAFPKTVTGQNWTHEAQPAIINDVTALSLPAAWSQVIETHLHTLTRSHIAKWLKSESPRIEPVRQWLSRSLKHNLNDEQMALITTASLEKDSDKLKELFATYNKKESEALLTPAAQAFANLRTELLAQRIEQTHRDYCARFLTADDELWGELKKTWRSAMSDEQWKQFIGLEFESGIKSFKRSLLDNPVQPMGRMWMNIPLLIEASAHNAFFNAHLDSDAAIRSAYLIARSGNQYLTSLPFKSYLVGQNLNTKVTLEKNLNLPSSKKVSEIELINEEGNPAGHIPTDISGRLIINYAGPQYMFPHVSAADLLNSESELTATQLTQTNGTWSITESRVSKLEFLKNKYLLAGATAIGIYDMRVTPFQENYPGVETHANVIDNLLRADFLKVHPDEEIYMPLLLLVLGLTLSYAMAKTGALIGLSLSALSLLMIYLVDKYVFFKHGLVTNITLPLFLVISLYVFLTFYKYFTEERKKKELKGTFEKYVSPAIVEEILADPSNLELGGRKEKITVFFSDVRGFTTISEKLDPTALSDLLNSYLTPMTRLVFEHKGTLDKYMGDAIMAFFGAPIHYPNHAEQACRCALAHLSKLRELQAEYERKGLPSIDIGIGLNTGDMSVGNMGSDIVRNYTVMGDAVNLGSRLEGINKQYGTRIIISESTQEEVKGLFITREIDRVRVKGKVLPVKIYELIAESHAPEDVTEMLKWFNQGYQEYQAKQWQKGLASFTQALNAKPNDECSKLYLQRCTDYLQNPPAEDWDGVFIMKTK